jgi:hypothetical protein
METRNQGQTLPVAQPGFVHATFEEAFVQAMTDASTVQLKPRLSASPTPSEE